MIIYKDIDSGLELAHPINPNFPIEFVQAKNPTIVITLELTKDELPEVSNKVNQFLQELIEDYG